jgi:HK97 family phage major capsid protein
MGRLNDTLAGLGKATQAVTEAAERATKPLYPVGGTPADAFGVPHVRKGEDPMSSRPFYLSNAVGMLRSDGIISPEQCKVERGVLDWFGRVMRSIAGDAAYQHNNSILVPLSWNHLPAEVRDSREGIAFREMTAQAKRSYDRDRASWSLQRYAPEGQRAAQSAYDQVLGGALVAPPEFGEPIELLRNEEVFAKAGAKIIPLPPQGSIKYPRLTSPTGPAAPQPENTAGNETTLGTGDVTLSAKPYSVFVRTSNQLLRFAPSVASALINEDMMKSLSLKIDLDALEGPGSDTRIRGLVNYSSINKVPAGKTGANGDSLQPSDGKRALSKVLASNAKFDGWIMRYETFYNLITEFRGDAVTTGDAAGMYLFNFLRQVSDIQTETWLNQPVHMSNQVSRSRQKGNATNLSYIVGGMMADYLLGMHGALELVANDKGDAAFLANQTLIRAIGYADGAPRHEASFSFIDNIIVPY